MHHVTCVLHSGVVGSRLQHCSCQPKHPLGMHGVPRMPHTHTLLLRPKQKCEEKPVTYTSCLMRVCLLVPEPGFLAKVYTFLKRSVCSVLVLWF